MKFVTLLLSLFICSNIFAWGQIGHRVVGEIASQNLSVKTNTQIKNLLGTQTLADVANWADFIKSDPTWSKAGPWHYVTIEDGKTYESSVKAKEGDVVWAINHFCDVLKDKKAASEDKSQAVKFITHFIGDIHQPLHVGKGDDRGGNDVNLTWFGSETNLHRIWDEQLIAMQDYSYTEYVKNINHPTSKEKKQWMSDDINVWIKESMDLRQSVYDIAVNKENYKKYGEYKYNFNNIKNINTAMVKAGLRLAATLDKCLK